MREIWNFSSCAVKIVLVLGGFFWAFLFFSFFFKSSEPCRSFNAGKILEKKLRECTEGFGAQGWDEGDNMGWGIEGGEKIWFSSSVRFVNQHPFSFNCHMSYFCRGLRCSDAGADILCVLPWRAKLPPASRTVHSDMPEEVEVSLEKKFPREFNI